MHVAFLLLAFHWCTFSRGLVAPTVREPAEGEEELFITAERSGNVQLNTAARRPFRLAEKSHARTIWATAHNSAVFVPCNNIVDYKVALLSKLASASPYPIVVGYDVGEGTTIPQAQLATLKWALREAIYEAQVVPVSYRRLLEKYGDKISNYLGVYQTNPAKLGIMDWFNSSGYSYLWHLEDDVWAPGVSNVFSEYESSRSDLIIRDSDQLPSWASAFSNWRVGDRSLIATGIFVYCNPSVFRMSKRFAGSVLRAIEEADTTNHHELWFPYVAQKWGLSWTSLQHSEHLRTNARSLGGGARCLDEVQDASILLAHPIKCMRHDGERSQI